MSRQATIFVRRVRTITETYEVVKTMSSDVRYVDRDADEADIVRLEAQPVETKVIENWVAAEALVQAFYENAIKSR